jgi:hypothetical protein
MTEPQQKTDRDIINKYSPLIRNKKGALGAALKTAAFPLEQGRNALGALLRLPLGTGYANTAGQSVEGCKAVIADTFARMEKKLQAGFKAASRRDADKPAQESFLQLAEDVSADGKILSQYCTVVSGAWSAAPEDYRFIVDPAAMTALDEGVHRVKQALGLIKAVEPPPAPVAAHLPPVKALPEKKTQILPQPAQQKKTIPVAGF